LLGYLDGVYGVKTGFTNGANRCLVTAVKRNNMDLICIVLGADTKKDRTRDTIKLIEYAFKTFSPYNIKEKIENEFQNWILCNSNSFSVSKGSSNDISPYLENLNYEYLPLSSNQIQNLSIYIYCNYTLTAPLEKDSSIGTLAVNIDDKNIITLNIKNENSISKMTYKDFFKSLIKNYPYCLESIIFNT